jgi:hypothetical protein
MDDESRCGRGDTNPCPGMVSPEPLEWLQDRLIDRTPCSFLQDQQGESPVQTQQVQDMFVSADEGRQGAGWLRRELRTPNLRVHVSRGSSLDHPHPART